MHQISYQSDYRTSREDGKKGMARLKDKRRLAEGDLDADEDTMRAVAAKMTRQASQLAKQLEEQQRKVEMLEQRVKAREDNALALLKKKDQETAQLYVSLFCIQSGML
jgi:hypothetical protein